MGCNDEAKWRIERSSDTHYHSGNRKPQSGGKYAEKQQSRSNLTPSYSCALGHVGGV